MSEADHTIKEITQYN
ncbi:hypothetical protein F383_33195 [Gossypium arboreum]|uniref:Uncharacterized protein n=1 Tax=Gossypium arboreum TaxID=29729 RepID=A0A0B0PP25_GOSAR|nr:hypothetical protein F383_33195 [Gossypium arboreum]